MSSTFLIRRCVGQLGGVTLRRTPPRAQPRRAFSTTAAHSSTSPVENDAEAARSRTPPKLPQVTLYQYEVCPFCNKVKALLDHYNMAYSTVEVNPLSKRELQPFKPMRRVPVAVIDGKAVEESDEIMDVLRAVVDKRQADVDELKWRNWANQRLVVTLPPNLYRSLRDAWRSFRYIAQSEKFGSVQAMYVRVAGALFMAAMKGRMMKKHGLTDERQALASLLSVWGAEAVGSKHFQHGDAAGIADLAVFGMLRSMVGMPTFDFAMENDKVRQWYGRMEDEVGQSCRISKQ